MTPSPGPRTLLIPCDSARGPAALPGAAAAFAIEEALRSRSRSCAILPAFDEVPSHSPQAWPFHGRRVLGGAIFDQAWIWLGRLPLDALFLDWLASVAPVRVGVLMAPLDNTAEAYRRSPHLLAHRAVIEQQLPHLTHVLACDEVDAASIPDRLGLPAMWLPAAVPGDSVRAAAGAVAGHPCSVVLIDDARDDTPGLASAPPLLGALERRGRSEENSSLSGRFVTLQREQLARLAAGTATAESLTQYVSSRQSIRLALQASRSRALDGAGIAVTLAPNANAYPLAMLECMAARVPVVCRDIPYRPRNRSLFMPQRHVRLFGINDEAGLARHLRELSADAGLAQAQADEALDVVRREHTAERRIDQVFEWLSSGRIPVEVSDERIVMRRERSAHHGFLPASYRRREPSSSSRGGSQTGDPALAAAADVGAEGEGHTEAYRVAVALARALGCTRLLDFGCPDPVGLVRAARDIAATVICSPHVARTYQRRCGHVAWHDITAPTADLLAGVECGDDMLVLCAMQFEASDTPDVLAGTLSSFVSRGRCGLVISVDRDLTWGSGDDGPPPRVGHLQEWAPEEIADLLRAAGLVVLHQSPIPAGLGRHEPGCTATIVAAAADPSMTAAASAACDAYVRQRARLTGYDLVETVAHNAPVFVTAAVPGAPDTLTLQVLLGDDRWSAMHSGRAPIEEAARWAESVPCAGDRPIILFGLGLGYHALALARVAPASRIVVLEPFPDVVARAREVAATREALDSGRIELIDGWRSFKARLVERPVPLASVCPVTIPVYERVADEAHAMFSTLLQSAIAWARADLDRACKPFLHAEGFSVVIATFNRVQQVTALVNSLAHQQPCNVPVELLVVNDHGTPAVFDAVRGVAQRTGCDLHTFDTYFAGYGPALARNIGLRHARYDTTVFLDDDVEVGPDLLRRYHSAPDGIRMGRIDFVYGCDDGAVRRVGDRRVALWGPDRVLRPWADVEGFMWSANCAVPTEVALALGGFDEAFLDEGEEDLDFSARAVRATHRPVAVSSAIALHQGLDHVGGVALKTGAAARPARANERLADPTRGLVVNGGVSYWAGERWQRYCVR